MATETEKLVENCQAAVTHGVNYLLDRLRPDGSYADVGVDLVAYYKSPYVLNRLGHPQRARRTLDFLLATFLDADGSLRKPGQETTNPGYATYLVNYMHTWVVRGAAALDDQQAVRHILGYLNTQQNATTGGVCRRRDVDRVDLGTTAALGVAALDAGDLDLAVRAGKFLIAALARQPGGDEVFLCFEQADPVREFPQAESVFFVIRTGEPAQAYWVPGIAIVFLTRLAAQTSDDAYLDGARAFVGIVDRCADDKYATLAGGKVGWGMKTLHHATGDKKSLDAAATIAQNLCTAQIDDGRWTRADPDDIAPTALAMTVDITAEISLWVHELRELLRQA